MKTKFTGFSEWAQSKWDEVYEREMAAHQDEDRAVREANCAVHNGSAFSDNWANKPLADALTKVEPKLKLA